MRVNRAGRYVIVARLEDSTGRAVALLTFNQVLNRGQQRARLQAFGKLLVDEGYYVLGLRLPGERDPTRAARRRDPAP